MNAAAWTGSTWSPPDVPATTRADGSGAGATWWITARPEPAGRDDVARMIEAGPTVGAIR